MAVHMCLLNDSQSFSLLTDARILFEPFQYLFAQEYFKVLSQHTCHMINCQLGIKIAGVVGQSLSSFLLMDSASYVQE